MLRQSERRDKDKKKKKEKKNSPGADEASAQIAAEAGTLWMSRYGGRIGGETRRALWPQLEQYDKLA